MQNKKIQPCDFYEMMYKKGFFCDEHAQTWGSSLVVLTLQSTAQQSFQLWVNLCFLLKHVKEQLILGGAVDLSLL